MTFLWPNLLWLLLLVPVLVAAYLFLLTRRKKLMARYSNLNMVREAMGSGPGFRRHIPPALLMLALVSMILAIARPVATLTLPTQRDTVILAMDISGSMRAADIEPDRITASQEAVRAFITDQPPNTRIGIVAFAGTVNLVQQPTLDREEIYSAIDRFQLQRGTNIGGAILTSLQTLFPEADLDIDSRDNPTRFRSGRSFDDIDRNRNREPEEFTPVEPGSYNNAAIVLLTDGQPTTGPNPIVAAQMAADRGVRIFTVGFGSREGDTVHFGGMSMRVQLDEDLLREIAEITRGRYFHAGSSTDLGEVYRTLTTQFVMETEEMEITAFFSAFAAILMLLSAFLSFTWFSRIV